VADDEIKVKVQQGGAFVGPIWLGGWLFTIGYLKLTVLNALLAIIIWPYDLGIFFHHS
jgi:hypothetical protein